MQDFAAFHPDGQLIAVLHRDLEAADPPPRFACRPLRASSADRTTVMGRFYGKVGLHHVNEFSAALEELVTENLMKVILDLGHVALSRSAVGVLLSFAATMHGRNKRLYLYRPSEQVRGSLRALGIESFFTFLETEEDIVARLVA